VYVYMLYPLQGSKFTGVGQSTYFPGRDR
jgi:hypothetical protein